MPQPVLVHIRRGRIGRVLLFAVLCVISAVRAVLLARVDVYDGNNLLNATRFEVALEEGIISIAELILENAHPKQLYGEPF